MSNRCQPDTSSINAKPMDTFSARMFQREHNYSLAVIKAESLYQISILLDVKLKLGFNSVITSYALVNIT